MVWCVMWRWCGCARVVTRVCAGISSCIGVVCDRAGQVVGGNGVGYVMHNICS